MDLIQRIEYYGFDGILSERDNKLQWLPDEMEGWMGNDEVRWFEAWGGARGVVVLNACDCGAEWQGTISKTIKLPQSTDNLCVNVVKNGYDGEVEFYISDSKEKFKLGSEILSGKVQKELSYNISRWVGKEVTIEISAHGAGTMMDPISECFCGTCCNEFIGIDWIKILPSGR
jgi:hypothetical protein